MIHQTKVRAKESNEIMQNNRCCNCGDLDSPLHVFQNGSSWKFNHFFRQEKHNTYTSLASYLVGLTKYSRVNSISKIDLAPAHTTATGVLPSSVRSALISNAVKKEQ